MRDCGCDNLFRMFEGYYGPYFTPTVDEAGNLTWENNAGLPNPPAVNIKGPKGDPGSGGGSGLTDEVKEALLQLAQKVAYIDANGQSYYDDLYDAFYGSAPTPTLTSITATYTQTGTIYTTDSVDVIPQRGTLVVTAHYSDSSSAVVASGYTLTGSLTEGASTVTVSYQGLTTTITVQVTAVVGTYTIQNNLMGCTTSNSATTIAEGSSYSATITASGGYTLTGATVSITMGGTALTGVYQNGTISIPNVTGNLVITVVAAARTVSSISAVYTQSGTVYDTDSIDSLKADLVVTANYSDSSTATVPAADYTLSGALTAGTSAVTVTYSGVETTFNVTVTAWDIEWVYTDGLPENNGFTKTYTTGTANMTSNGLECSGSSLAWTPNNEQTATTTIFETVFIPEILSSQNSANGNGFKLAVFNGSRAMTVGVNSQGVCYYNAALSGYSVATSNISTNTEYLLRIETGQSEGKIYLDGELISTVALASTSTTNSRVFGAASAGSGKTLIKAIRYDYVT